MESYLPIESINPEHIVIYNKWFAIDAEFETKLNKICLLSSQSGMCHPYCGFNRFASEAVPVPNPTDGWIDFRTAIRNEYKLLSKWKHMSQTMEEYMTARLALHTEEIKSFVFDPSFSVFTVSNIEYPFDQEDYVTHKTLAEEDIGFVVFVKKDNSLVYVYGRDPQIFIDTKTDRNDLKVFSKLIATYRPIQIFIDNSSEHTVTDCSCHHDGHTFDGNSILLKIDQSTYVHIGMSVFVFTSVKPIISYVETRAKSENLSFDMSSRIVSRIKSDTNDESTGIYRFETINIANSVRPKCSYTHEQVTGLIRMINDN